MPLIFIFELRRIEYCTEDSTALFIFCYQSATNKLIRIKTLILMKVINQQIYVLQVGTKKKLVLTYKQNECNLFLNYTQICIRWMIDLALRENPKFRLVQIIVLSGQSVYTYICLRRYILWNARFTATAISYSDLLESRLGNRST